MTHCPLRPRFGAALALAFPLALAAGCGVDPRAIIQGTAPPNGATAVDTRLRPALTLGEAIRLVTSRANPRARLLDITGGRRAGLAGRLVQEGASVTFIPTEELDRSHDYVLEVDRAAFEGDAMEDLDASEWPDEPLPPRTFRLYFSTRSAPRVRAVYLDRSGDRPVLHVRFSQPMDPVTAGAAITARDELNQAVKLGPPIWARSRDARITVITPLRPEGVYTLAIAGSARALDGSLLDGDEDGQPGGPGDDFSVRFTGSQRVVLSRLRAPGPVTP